MNHGKQDVEPSIPLGRTWRKFPEDMSQRYTLQESHGSHQRMESQEAVQTPGGGHSQYKGKQTQNPSYRRTIEPDRAYSGSLQLTRSRTTKISSCFTPFKHQEMSGQEAQFFTITGSFQEEKMMQGEKQDLFQPQTEGVSGLVYDEAY
ncbi:hypothetical protein O181_131147 [Austropuccinia psidii MF-1]|uniref:Uncharacterized protein n=1 Tax=Austropuccinia psidii MF-1 TaxID=1389203 RepID=A0A9Q3L2H8_9BASI|nr:hypothetical protein [Austropuccinia psidii MF-1]